MSGFPAGLEESSTGEVPNASNGPFTHPLRVAERCVAVLVTRCYIISLVAFTHTLRHARCCAALIKTLLISLAQRSNAQRMCERPLI